LEVHIYMRGYFPVKGLYANLAEKQSKAGLEGGARKPKKINIAVKTTTGTADFPLEKFLNRKEKLSDLSAQQISNLGRLAGNMQTLQQYMEQLGREGKLHTNFKPGSVWIGINDGYAQDGHRKPGQKKSEGHVEGSQHFQGTAADFTVRYRTTDGKAHKASRSTAYAATIKLRGGKMQAGGAGAYLRADLNPGATSGSKNPHDYTPTTSWFTANHYDCAGEDRDWVWYANPGLGEERLGEAKGERRTVLPKAIKEEIAGLPDPDDTVVAWDKHPRTEAPKPDEPDEPKESDAGAEGGFQGDQASLEVPVGPSVLEEMGLPAEVADTLAYPYYHVFHGVVTQVNHSYSGGVSTVSVTCNSILHFWQYHNMSTNASVFGARPTNSKNKMSLVGNNFTGMHPYAIIYALHYDMAGAAGGVGWALSSKSNQTAVSKGGESLFSLNVLYWEKRFRKGTRLRMHGATGELFSTLAATWMSKMSSSALTRLLRDRFNDPKEYARNDIGANGALAVGVLGTTAQRKAVEATIFQSQSRPTQEAKANLAVNILEMQAFVSNIGEWGQVNLFESSYESKLDVAQKVCQITGFEFYQDVDGDFVFKPPMWNLDTSGSRVYRLEDIDIININFSEKEPQVTYMTVKGTAFTNILGTGTDNEWGVRGQYIDYRLVAQFGWRPGSYETNYFNDPKSMFFSAVNRMDVMNIATNSASVTIPVRPELRPGYPVYIPYLDCFYYCNSFAHSHSVGGQCTTTLQLVGKRAKFYAPGLNNPYTAGVDAIKLGETYRPERPLGIYGPDGKPQNA
jgi:hypothetical protein